MNQANHEILGRARFDRGAFIEDPAAPTVTPGGDPWVRWVKSDPYSGWFAQGHVTMAAREPKFWLSCLRLLCRVHGTRVDRVHACGPGILALGALGVTLATDAGARLLYECLRADPVVYLDLMAPALALGFIYPVGDTFHEEGKRTIPVERVREVVVLGSTGTSWRGPQKDRAHVWTSCCSKLLGQKDMLQAQADLIARVVPFVMKLEVRGLVRWPREIDGLWQYTPEQRALWLFALVLSTVDADATAVLLREHAGGDSHEVLASIGRVLPSLVGSFAESARLVATELKTEDLWRETLRMHPS